MGVWRLFSGKMYLYSYFTLNACAKIPPAPHLSPCDFLKSLKSDRLLENVNRLADNLSIIAFLRRAWTIEDWRGHMSEIWFCRIKRDY